MSYMKYQKVVSGDPPTTTISEVPATFVDVLNPTVSLSSSESIVTRYVAYGVFLALLR